MQIQMYSPLLIQDSLTSLGPILSVLITLLLRSAHVRYMLTTCYSSCNLILLFGWVSTDVG